MLNKMLPWSLLFSLESCVLLKMKEKIYKSTDRYSFVCQCLFLRDNVKDVIKDAVCEHSIVNVSVGNVSVGNCHVKVWFCACVALYRLVGVCCIKVSYIKLSLLI